MISKEIESHYLEGLEADRLSVNQGELERLRTLHILGRSLPPPPARIFDIGGAAGAYAFSLSERGYDVHLIDPVELHLEQARARSASSGIRLSSIGRGDARQLDISSETADVVLMLGPLYHLVERSDRLKALREARRILRRQGLLFAAVISRFASLIHGVLSGAFENPEFRKIVATDLATGQHRNRTNNPAYFTTAYFHRPAELSAELKESGFGDARIHAVEGPAWAGNQFLQVWNDFAQRDTLMEFLALIDQEPSICGASAHLLAVAQKSNS